MIPTVEPVREAPILLRVDEAARLLGVSRSHAYQLIANGSLPVVRLGRSTRVARSALDSLVAELADGDGGLNNRR